jgi:proteasome lid subunit RPN8/RPN11
MRASSSSPTVYLVAGVRDALEAFWRARGLSEPCGFLLGVRQDDDCVSVLGIERAENLHPTPARAWRISIETTAAARRGARAAGLELLGYWHAHLVGAAVPGRQDREGADPLRRDVHVILGRSEDDPGKVDREKHDRCAMGAWIAERGNFSPARLELTPEPATSST